MSSYCQAAIKMVILSFRFLVQCLVKTALGLLDVKNLKKLKNQHLKAFQYAAIVTIGGYVFGLDAAVTSGTVGFITSEFSLSDLQIGMVVSAPGFEVSKNGVVLLNITPRADGTIPDGEGIVFWKWGNGCSLIEKLFLDSSMDHFRCRTG